VKHRDLAILLLVAIASLLLVFADPWGKSPAEGPYRLLGESDMSSLNGVRLTSKGVEYAASTTTPTGAWLCLAPQRGTADPTAVRRMLGTLRLLRSIRSAPRSEAQGLGSAGLVSLSFSAGKRTLEVGTLTADGRNQWIAIYSDPRAHLVETHLLADFFASVEALLSLEVVPWRADGSELLRIESANRWLQWQGETIEWMDEAGAKHEIRVDQGKALAWSDAFSKLVETKETCASPPTLRISQGEKVAMLSEKLCVSPEPLANVLSGWRDPWSLARMRLFNSRRPAGDFTIRCGDSERRVHVAEVAQDALWDWWAAFDDAPRSLAATIPNTVLCTINGDDWTVTIGIEDDRLLATSPHPGLLFELDPKVQSKLRSLAMLFSSTLLIEEDAVFLQQLESTHASRTRRWERGGQAGSWREGGKLSSQDEARLVTELSRTLATLTAERFADEEVPKGTTAPQRKLRAFFDAALGEGITSYDINLWGSADECTATVAGGPRAVLDRRDCAVLWNSRLY
jgi:hypothetical protein